MSVLYICAKWKQQTQTIPYDITVEKKKGKKEGKAIWTGSESRLQNLLL